MDALQALAQGLEASAFGAWARGSSLAYPVANLVHLLGLVMLIGAIGVVDLRLMGAFRSLPPQALSRALVPVAAGGLALMIPSGLVMFAADAGPLLNSNLFRWKLALIALALANVAAFHLLWGRRRGGGLDAVIRPGARAMAIASLGLWLTVAALGRLVAYS